MNIVISSTVQPIVNATSPINSIIGLTTFDPGSIHITKEEQPTVDLLIPASSSLSVIGLPGEEGPPGPPGPEGPPGPTTGGFFRYVQVSPSVVWLITHSLGYYPNVTAVDSAQQAIIPEISYPSSSQIVLTFSASVAGEAYLS
jgi:hypothetical protein